MRRSYVWSHGQDDFINVFFWLGFKLGNYVVKNEINDNTGFDKDISEKKGINAVQPGEIFEKGYQILVG